MTADRLRGRAAIIKAWNDLPDAWRCHPALKQLYQAAQECEDVPSPAEEDEKGLALWQLIYGAIAHEPLPLKVGQIEAAARRVADMLTRREASKVQPKGMGPVFMKQDERAAIFLEEIGFEPGDLQSVNESDLHRIAMRIEAHALAKNLPAKGKRT